MTDWPEQSINDWEHLYEFVHPIAGACVFRGQANRDWPLVTSFGRIFELIPKEELQRLEPATVETAALDLERNAILTFRSEAHLYLNQSLLPPDPFKLEQADTYLEWLVLMQHYGAPTRLLDWTQSPYVALYFAVIDDSECDAAIWYFDPSPVREIYLKHYKKDPKGLQEFDFVNLKAKEFQATQGDTILFTGQKKMRTGREIAQQGQFTFANRVLADHQVAIANTCRGCRFGKIIIPRRLKRNFARELMLMNVTASAIFPGVDGICWSIRDRMRLNVRPGDES